MSASLVAGLPLPLLPAQILWLNLVTNWVQDVALAFEPGEGGELQRSPRWPTERIFDRLMAARTTVAAAVMGGVSFLTCRWLLEHGYGEGEARNLVLLLMVLFQLVHIGNCRSETRPASSLPPQRNPLLVLGTLTALGAHMAALRLPALQRFLGTAPVGLEMLGVLLALSLTVLASGELQKWARARRGT